MSYLSLERRVPEGEAIEPRTLARLYELISRLPVVQAAQRRFLAGALGQGVWQGVGLDLGTGPGCVGGYYESVRAAYTQKEARALLTRSALPPGEMGLDSTGFLSILTISSKGSG